MTIIRVLVYGFCGLLYKAFEGRILEFLASGSPEGVVDIPKATAILLLATLLVVGLVDGAVPMALKWRRSKKIRNLEGLWREGNQLANRSTSTAEQRTAVQRERANWDSRVRTILLESLPDEAFGYETLSDSLGGFSQTDSVQAVNEGADKMNKRLYKFRRIIMRRQEA